MDQDRDAELAVLVLEPPLLGPDPPLDHRVDRLEVAGVRRQRQVDHVLVGRDVVGREAEVVLDVAVAADGLGLVPLEFAEEHAVRLVQDVGQHVEPAPVRHPQHDLADPELRRPLDDRVQERDQHLAPFEREPLLADVVRVEERLEELGRVQLVDDPPLLPEVELRPVADRLHPLLEPVADLRVADVHVLDADLPAVRRPQRGDQLAQGGVGPVGHLVVELLVEVVLRQPERRQVEQLVRVARRVELQRVEVRQVMADLAIGVDQPGDLGLRRAAS